MPRWHALMSFDYLHNGNLIFITGWATLIWINRGLSLSHNERRARLGNPTFFYVLEITLVNFTHLNKRPYFPFLSPFFLLGVTQRDTHCHRAKPPPVSPCPLSLHITILAVEFWYTGMLSCLKCLFNLHCMNLTVRSQQHNVPIKQIIQF